MKIFGRTLAITIMATLSISSVKPAGKDFSSFHYNHKPDYSNFREVIQGPEHNSKVRNFVIGSLITAATLVVIAKRYPQAFAQLKEQIKHAGKAGLACAAIIAGFIKNHGGSRAVEFVKAKTPVVAEFIKTNGSKAIDCAKNGCITVANAVKQQTMQE